MWVKKKVVGLLAILLILFSPLFGGLLAKMFISFNVFRDVWHTGIEDALSYGFSIVSWIVASVIFYITFRE